MSTSLTHEFKGKLLGSVTQPLTEKSARDRTEEKWLGSRARPVHGRDKFTLSVSHFPRECGIFNISHAYRPPWPTTCTTLLSLTMLYMYVQVFCCILVLQGYSSRPVTGIGDGR